MKKRRILENIYAGGSVIAAPTAIVMAVAVVLASAAPELLRDDKTSEIDEIVMDRLVEQLSDSFLGTGIGRDGSTSWEDLDDVENDLAYPGFGIDNDFEYVEDEEGGTRTQYYAIDDLIIEDVILVNLTEQDGSIMDGSGGGALPGGSDGDGDDGDLPGGGPTPDGFTHSYVQFIVSNDDPNNIADNEGFEYRVEISPYEFTTASDQKEGSNLGYLVAKGNITKHSITKEMGSMLFHSHSFIRCELSQYNVTVTVSPLPRLSVGDFNWSNNKYTINIGSGIIDPEYNKPPMEPKCFSGPSEILFLPTFDSADKYPDYVLQKEDGEKCKYLTSSYSKDVYGVQVEYGAVIYDLEGDLVKLRFDWNAVQTVDARWPGEPPYDPSEWYPLDGPVKPLTEPWPGDPSGAAAPGPTVTVPKLWTRPGTYFIKAQAQDFPGGNPLPTDRKSRWSTEIKEVKVMTPEEWAAKYISSESIVSSLRALDLSSDSDDEEPPDPPTVYDEYVTYGAQLVFHVAVVEPKHSIIYQEELGEIELGGTGFGGEEGSAPSPPSSNPPDTGNDPVGNDNTGGNFNNYNNYGTGGMVLGGMENTGQTGDCLAEGTLILMKDGTKKPIEKLELGDKVLSFDYSKQMNIESNIIKVSEITKKGIYNVNDGLLQVTGSHPLLARKPDGKIVWTAVTPIQSNMVYDKHASKLELGDQLLTSDGEWVKVESIQYKLGEIKTYTFMVDADAHNYYANGILVSNGGDYELGGQSEGSSKITTEKNTRSTAPVISYQKIVKFGMITNRDRIGKLLGIPDYIHFRIYVNMELNGRWTTILDWPVEQIDAENKIEYETNVLIYNSLGNRQYTLHHGVLGIEIAKGGTIS